MDFTNKVDGCGGGEEGRERGGKGERIGERREETIYTESYLMRERKRERERFIQQTDNIVAEIWQFYIKYIYNTYNMYICIYT